MKFEDWDLVDIVKFPHLETDELMDQKIEGMVTTLQPNAWLQEVDKAGLLYLLSIPYILWSPITMLVIKQLPCLVHEDILWVGKLVCITAGVVHRVLHLPYDGRDPLEIIDKGNDVAMIEQLKKKYQLAKGHRGYIIDSISENAVHVAPRLLAGKVMRKCHGTKVPAIVITLVEECTAIVRFNWSQFLVKSFRPIAMTCRRKA